MVIEGENWRCKVYTKHIQYATSLALMSKRDIYEKLINSRSEGEMRKWSTTIIKDQREKAVEAINTEGVIVEEEDQTNRGWK